MLSSTFLDDFGVRKLPLTAAEDHHAPLRARVPF
jgi:hypothetical protein